MAGNIFENIDYSYRIWYIPYTEDDEMERRIARVNSSMAGGTASVGSKTHKVTIPSRWINRMGITDENREVELTFDGDKIIITRIIGLDEFVAEKSTQAHQLMKLLFWNGDDLCTIIVADFTDHTLFVENHTQQLVKTAFGENRFPTWDEFMSFLEERCIPRQREGLHDYLAVLGLDEYDPLAIIQRTQGRMAEDQQWIEVEEL